MTCVVEIISAFLGGEVFADCGSDDFDGARGRLVQQMLELGKDLFDRAKVGGVFRKNNLAPAERMSRHVINNAETKSATLEVQTCHGRDRSCTKVADQSVVVDVHLQPAAGETRKSATDLGHEVGRDGSGPSRAKK